MQEIDCIIDDQTELAMELVNLDIRNTQAHKELQYFNDTGSFALVHPIVIKNNYKTTERGRLRSLQKDDPLKFLDEVANTKQNIRRIESDIRTKKYKSEEELLSWNDNLERANIKLNLLVELIR